MKHVIITGASRGLGRAIAESLAFGNFVLHLVSRSDMDELQDALSADTGGVFTYNADLSLIDDIETLMDDIFENVVEPEFLSLINNASTIAPVGPLGRIDSNRIDELIRLDLTAPLVMMNEFISRCSEFDAEKRIINISSGAGQKPYYGWSGYCAAKAGLDIASRTVSLEQNEIRGEDGVKVLSIAPGIIDTAMQESIRKQPKDNFIYVGKFIEFYKSGALKSPEEVAEKIREILFLDFFPDGEVLDIREF